jgi:hypothetical protein
VKPLVATPNLLFAIALILVLLVLAGRLLWFSSAERRKRQVAKWAQTNLVALTPDVTAALDRALASRNRINAVSMLLFGAAVLPLAFVDGGVSSSWMAWGWTTLGLAFLASVLTGNRQLARPWFAVGPTRSARPRAVELADYVYSPLRWRAWASAVICLSAAALVVWRARSVTEAAGVAPAIGVAASVGVAEWMGRRTASRPQPAGDAAELYALDAWRADVTSSEFHDLGLMGLYMMPFLSSYTASTTVSAILLLAALGLLLLTIATRHFGAYNITWVRHRLWPTLEDGEVLDAEVVSS